MKKNTFARLTVLLIFLSFPFSVLVADGSTIYLVRHGKNVTHVFSTPYKRTKDTAAPTAHEHGILVEEYNPDEGKLIVDKLKTLSGVVLVTGHSNTIPRLVNLLVGTSFEDLDERVYDRVYIVTLDEHGHAELEISYSEPRTPTR
jgi:broad specificity phosphatase PhoE